MIKLHKTSLLALYIIFQWYMLDKNQIINEDNNLIKINNLMV